MSEHSANFEFVVRFNGNRHFGYDVTCDCGFVCKKHYSRGGASRCAVEHDRQAPDTINTVRRLDPEEEDAALEGFRAVDES